MHLCIEFFARLVCEQGSAFIEFAKERGATKALATLQEAVFYGKQIVLDTLA